MRQRLKNKEKARKNMRVLYKGKLAVAAIFALLMTSFTGCGGDELANDLGEKIGDSVKEAVSDAKQHVGDEIKNALVNEVKAYITSDEMTEALGISLEEQENILNAVRGYIDNYEFDAEQMKEAKESIEELLQNANELSADEIKENIVEIFEQNKEE